MRDYYNFSGQVFFSSQFFIRILLLSYSRFLDFELSIKVVFNIEISEVASLLNFYESLIEISKSQKDLYITYKLKFESIMYSFDPLQIFVSNTFIEDKITEKPYFFLLKIALFQIGIK